MPTVTASITLLHLAITQANFQDGNRRQPVIRQEIFFIDNGLCGKHDLGLPTIGMVYVVAVYLVFMYYPYFINAYLHALGHFLQWLLHHV